jgi:hypothetical protein
MFEQKYTFHHPSHGCLLQLYTLQALSVVAFSHAYTILCLHSQMAAVSLWDLANSACVVLSGSGM